MAGSDGSPVRTVLSVGVIAIGAALLVSATYELTRERIAANARARLLRSLSSVLAPEVRGGDFPTVRITATDPELLGAPAPVDVFVVGPDGAPAAIVFASVAPNGYNAPIQLLIGLSPDGTVTGVRAVSHRETPGLGDAIEIGKSRWITQFDGTSLAAPAHWAVARDDGPFDSITGATVTSRAVVQAVHGTLRYFTVHRDDLFAAAAAADPE
jgi:electron transport complex protein RnfG